MKKVLLLIFALCFGVSFAQQQEVDFFIDPCTFQENETITFTFDGSSIDESIWNIGNNALYLWAWSFDTNDQNIQDSPTNGEWTNSNEANRLTYNSGNDTYTISFIPTVFYGRTGIGRIGFLVKAKNGDGDKKTQDIVTEVGESSFQINLNNPTATTSVLNSGDDFSIAAENTCGNADYTLTINGVVADTQNNTSSYTFTDANITENKVYNLEVALNGDTKSVSISVLIDPGSSFEILSGTFQDGINYDANDATKATLMLYAPNKDFVYVAGSFNNWQPDASYAMKRDFTRNGRFWLELTNLVPGQIETFQYWVVDKAPITNSPGLVKTADPFSTLVLSPFDDPFIPSSTYPNLPVYPAGQEREVTVLQTNQTPYNWQVTDFNKPNKEDLIIYVVLVRDFDANRNYQDIIDRIDYFKDLNINAIQFMPVMEFEGNESWGYNTSFHMALDKFYGTEEKFKELIDVCHQNGIAVILDIALNHAFGRNPMVRMWMDDADGDGWGSPSSENPYFNTAPRHSYNVGSDFDHSNSFTGLYTKQVVKHWIENFKIDGFRWDLTKGFTQNCTENDEGCTNSYQQDRIDILKEYADYSWSLDPEHYVIFEHLGSENEEKEWANYRYDEGKGIMMWGKMTDPYNELTMGQNGNKNINGIGHNSRPSFNGPRVIGYPESHDEERLMFKNLAFGETSNSNHNVQDLNIALSRMSALAAVSVMVPGPKMIWHFGELGMENSIFTCTNGSTNFIGNADGNGDCKLDTKPQPQWANNWLSDAIRGQIYDDWSKLHQLKIEEAVFEGDYTMTSGNFTPRIEIFDNSIPTTALNYVIIVANFDVTTQTVNTDFPAGVSTTWYDLMDATGSTIVSNTTTSISIPAGQFRILGNQPPNVLSVNTNTLETFTLYPNPTQTSFSINTNASTIQIYEVTGKLVKTFNGNFSRTDIFDISTLNTGMYLVKVKNNNNTQIRTTKLIKL
ncbi:alpha-amylase family glycosyl hydrolase [uncultured Winogradskyella sp.]|uniref:alpha-amylase family glycosyl hydrolase n=1 Tax=uncultured Winogradskyella sp. TaxID=395353 RepID=UPI0030D885CA|tara:strand:+ start:91769 stop:94660 length:2892 start_codon:yes stop_codon:yes gene_type:complete